MSNLNELKIVESDVKDMKIGEYKLNVNKVIGVVKNYISEIGIQKKNGLKIKVKTALIATCVENKDGSIEIITDIFNNEYTNEEILCAIKER
jgi:hypothetical protein